MPDQNEEPRFSLKLWLERFGPFVLGVGTFATLLWIEDGVIVLFSSKALSLSSLYAAIFDWSAIQTGFLFGVYGFVVGRTEGFVGALRGTQMMSLFQGYTKKATVIGFLLTIISIPLIVATPEPTPGDSWLYMSVAAWFSIFIWAFLAFLRVAYLFGSIVRVPDRDEELNG